MATEKQIWKELEKILDPELHIPLTDMGLIYGVKETEGDVVVTMTLTTIGCPLFSTIEKTVVDALTPLPGVKNVSVKLVFDPPWTIDMMTDEVKMKLGLL